MTNSESTLFEKSLLKVFNSAIEERLQKESEEAINEATKRVRSKLAETIAAISISIVKRVSIEHYRNEIIVHIKMEDKGSE